MSILPRLAPLALACALVSWSPPVAADPFSVDQMLDAESFGAVAITPDERWIMFERRGPYRTAQRFDLGYFNSWSTSEIWIAESAAPQAARRLLPDRGVTLGAMSPSGDRFTVQRLMGDRWETGVVSPATGTVQWLGVGAEPPTRGETTLWLSDHELILVARKDRDLPYEMGALARGVRETHQRREATAGGGVGVTVWGAGTYADTAGYAAMLQVLRIDLRSGSRVVLAEGQTTDIALSSDDRYLAIIARGPPNAVVPGPPLRPTDPAESRRLTILDLESEITWSPCGACDVRPELLSWSSDARLLFAIETSSADPEDVKFTIADPLQKSVETVPLDGLVPDIGADLNAGTRTVRAAWLQEHPVLLARREGEERSDWYALRRGSAINLTGAIPGGPGALAALWSDGLATTNRGAVWFASALGPATRPEGPGPVQLIAGGNVWTAPRLRFNTPPTTRDVLGRSDDGAVWRLTFDDAERLAIGSVPEIVAVSGDVVVDLATHDGVQSLRVLSAVDEPRVLSVANGEAGVTDFAEPLQVVAPVNVAGVSDSLLFAPPAGLKPSTPLIVVAYPGAPARIPDNPAAFSSMANVQLLAAMGYAVLVPSVAGTGIDGPRAGLAERIIAVLDAALAQYPDLDGGKVGYLGHSFGGYAGLILATESRRFRSFVILSASSNLASVWGGFAGFARANQEFGLIPMRRSVGWSETGQGAMGGPPWQHSQDYVRNSPFFRAGDIQDPVLLIHGELDFVPVTEAENLFTALWRQDKDVQLVTYWGEQHVFYSPETIRDLWARIDAWFADTVGISPARTMPSPVSVPNDAPTLQETRPPGPRRLHRATADHPRSAARP